ncbi:DNA-binding response regulator [Lysinibacillus sp. 2017]|uniref:response regulator transcription factor n=1 Tax=unclassified Lysinibacillus TaxID=2636778 RepID=UPI000D525FEA|nr:MULTISPECIES: response regulator transcription factor [unclassified Lysinibacillus]AWE07771.1 DNA-binding response regulator [Lysinibacillus sp. 2017]TGN34590.1 response regulator transcription factor [Lysinibacillus sp. S2017]
MEEILLVEDDREIARIIKDTLTNEGYHVAWATTGLEGLADFYTANFDLLIVDWMLPEMEGLSLIEHIRLQSDVPIIMISAKSEDSDKVTGLQEADDYLAKPFSLEELKARVRSQLKRWRRYHKVPEDRVIHFANGLQIDWQQERVYLKENEINLTQKEFALLKVLAQNPFELFTKEALYTHVWQQVELDQTHTVTVHIKALREKLQDPVKSPYFIQTVWGKGYRFVGEPL